MFVSKASARFFAILAYLILLVTPPLLGGCVTVLDATSDGPIRRDPGERTLGAYIDDKQIKTIISVNLQKAEPALEKANIEVTVYNGVVLLTGQVQNQKLREKAGDIARNVLKVRQVYNELQILPNTSFLSRANDTWLATKINTKLMAHKDIDSDRVVVVVDNSIVYLMGLLTPVQTEKITDVARTTKGVSKVVRAIEYIE